MEATSNQNINKEKLVIDVESEDKNVNESQDVGENIKKEEKPFRRKSWVWNHFPRPLKGETKTKCPYCNIIMAGDTKVNGTGSLANHLKNICTRSPVYKKPDLKKQSKLNLRSTTKGTSLLNHSFSQEKCRIGVARMCIKDNRPFSIVDDEGFRDLLSECCPEFRIPSRWTVDKDCLSIYKEEMQKLKEVLRDKTVSLTTDTWTSVQNINYACITVHWVDDSWVLRKRILNFCQIPNHKGETIGKVVYKCLQKWGIKRVLTVTVDNASSNDGAIRYLATMLTGPHAILDCKYLHLRCCAHIINLVVRDGLQEQFTSISKIRNAVRYVRSSGSRYDSFKESVDKVAIDCGNKPCLDVETRWNSTYLMLETAEKFEAAFDRLHSVDYNYRSHFRGIEEDVSEDTTRSKKRKKSERVVGAPLKEDWENARCFIEYLKIFYNVTKRVSGSKYVTSNLFFTELVTMHKAIARMCLSEDEKKKNMALSMKKKYEKYWDDIDNINFLLHVSLVLDPRNKKLYLGYSLEKIHGKHSPKVAEIMKQTIDTLNALFAEYKAREDGMIGKNINASSSSTINVSESGYEDEEADYARYLEENGQAVGKTEVEIYLEDATEKRDDKLDVLNWWKVNSVKFPILSQVAKHVLAMPISTVASESAFSTGGRVIDEYRSSLTPKTAQALICAQDWIRSSGGELQDVPLNAEELQDLVENLENLELQEFPTTEKHINDLFMDEEWE